MGFPNCWIARVVDVASVGEAHVDFQELVEERQLLTRAQVSLPQLLTRAQESHKCLQ